MKKLFSTLWNLGIDKNSLEEEAVRIGLTNRLSFGFSLFASVYIFIFYSFGYTYLSILTLIVSSSFMMGLLYNYFGLHLLSKLNIIVTTNACVFYYAAVLGPETGIQLVFYTISIVPFTIFGFREKKTMFSCIAIPFICMLFLFLTDYSIFGTIEIIQQIKDTLYISILFLTFVMLILPISLFYNLFFQQEKNLRTAYKEAKKRNLIMEKLSQQAAFTRLSMGIAHEIRNPMAGMLGRAEYIEKKLDDPKEVKRFAEIVRSSIDKILNITDTMLKYGAPYETNKTFIHLDKIIDEVSYIISGKCKQKRIKLTIETEKFPNLIGESTQIYQIILNLCLNAIQAVSNGGILTISSSAASFVNKKKVSVDGIHISIKDDGPGISNENLEKIFDPFFTTKYQNTGLGLSIVLKNIDKHDGIIDFQSKLGKGTTVNVYLPFKQKKEN
ncbi:hypothetical protein HOG98_01645 [bacterium]|jgi:signal transduction histidine kinase|nr:hypothetical protein [bacterium]